jgi:hypothetical protein
LIKLPDLLAVEGFKCPSAHWFVKAFISAERKMKDKRFEETTRVSSIGVV